MEDLEYYEDKLDRIIEKTQAEVIRGIEQAEWLENMRAAYYRGEINEAQLHMITLHPKTIFDFEDGTSSE